MKSLTAALGIEWDKQLKEDMKVIYDSMNAQNSNGIDAWASIKKIGKAGFVDEAPAAYEKVEKVCKTAGLFIVAIFQVPFNIPGLPAFIFSFIDIQFFLFRHFAPLFFTDF